MSKTTEFNVARAVLGALLLAVTLSCSRTEKPKSEFTSAGRGAPVAPAIPWQQWRSDKDIEAVPTPEIKDYPEKYWLVGPLDGPSTGGRLTAFLGSARNGAVPEGIRPLPVDIFTSK